MKAKGRLLFVVLGFGLAAFLGFNILSYAKQDSPAPKGQTNNNTILNPKGKIYTDSANPDAFSSAKEFTKKQSQEKEEHLLLVKRREKNGKKNITYNYCSNLGYNCFKIYHIFDCQAQSYC